MMKTNTNSTDLLTATISFRLSEDEYRSLNSRADHEHRTVSNLCRMLLRTVVPSPAEPTQRQG
jgi:hypothetical protein